MIRPTITPAVPTICPICIVSSNSNQVAIPLITGTRKSRGPVFVVARCRSTHIHTDQATNAGTIVSQDMTNQMDSHKDLVGQSVRFNKNIGGIAMAIAPTGNFRVTGLLPDTSGTKSVPR